MKPIHNILYALFLLPAIFSSPEAGAVNPEITAKHVRNYVAKGNEAYNKGDYPKAETFYKNALQEDPNSDIAMFNLAMSLIRQSKGQQPGQQAAEQNTDKYSDPGELLKSVAGNTNNKLLASKAFYNLGNVAFARQDYATSIEMYKEALRGNPDDIKARQNLRVAQLKYRDQQQNQDQNKDQNQQNQQDQKNQNQQNQQQNQQNKDQNQDKQNQQDKKDQNQQNQNQNNPQDKANGSPASAKPEMSKENAEKILESAAKQEEQTRKKVEQKIRDKTTQRVTGNPW